MEDQSYVAVERYLEGIAQRGLLARTPTKLPQRIFGLGDYKGIVRKVEEELAKIAGPNCAAELKYSTTNAILGNLGWVKRTYASRGIEVSVWEKSQEHSLRHVH